MTRGVRVLGLQLLFELTVKDLIVLIFSLLLGMEFQNFFEAFMNQETFIQHLEIESCHVQLTGLWRERQISKVVMTFLEQRLTSLLAPAFLVLWRHPGSSNHSTTS